MLTVLLVHAVNEYLLQPDRLIVLKRAGKPVSPVALLLHVAPPAAACLALGAVDVRGAIILMVLHSAIDSQVGKFILRRLPGQTAIKSMEGDHGQWPLQVHALHLALAAVNEQFSWALLHIIALMIAMRLAGLQ